MRATIKLLLASVILTLNASSLLAATDSLLLEDFETPNDHWTFSAGAEFPGAKGSFVRSTQSAHDGQNGGRLNFDFTGGGNYVAAVFKITTPPPTNWNALQLWIKRPSGNALIVRYTDPTGQTFQKPVECGADRWRRLTVPFGGWTAHWGGANDGKVHGPPVMLALAVDNGENTTGSVDFDEWRLVVSDDQLFHASYASHQFDPGEGWRTRSEGNAGATKLAGKTWSLDFSSGAKSLSLAVGDRTLIGSVDKIHLRVKGSAKGHPVRLIMHTHFMTFHKVIGEFAGEGEQELVTDGPPGPGWEWHSGENDGKLHGPLRLTDIQLAANGHGDRCTLEMIEVRMDASCPPERQGILVARTREQNGQATFEVQLSTMTGKMPAGRVVWTMRTWDGKEVGQGSSALPVVATPISVPVPQLTGVKFVEVEFALDVAGQEIPSAKAVWLAPLENKGDAAIAPESPFGMGLYLGRYGGDARGLATMERAAQMARDAGVKWTREDFLWSRMEPRKGEFDWTYYDNLVACAKRNGITVYGIACYWSAWTKPYTQEGVEDYIRYLKAMVGHYQKDIKQWEIWNEPNIFFWQGPKELYAELLTRSYAAIKEVDPQAQVLGLSTAGIDFKFIDQMLALKTPFDILTIHPYRTVLKDDEFMADLQKASDKVQLPDGRKRPVWLTEMGWATFTQHNSLPQDFVATSLRAQAELIARSYLCAIVSGVEPRTFWYDFRNDGDDPINFEHQMGIIYSDFRPKPAYQAYATLTQVLKDRVLAGPVAANPGTYAYRFNSTKGAGSVIALWNPKQSVSVTLAAKAASVPMLNTVGERNLLVAANGQITVPVPKGAPVYLIMPL